MVSSMVRLSLMTLSFRRGYNLCDHLGRGYCVSEPLARGFRYLAGMVIVIFTFLPSVNVTV